MLAGRFFVKQILKDDLRSRLQAENRPRRDTIIVMFTRPNPDKGIVEIWSLQFINATSCRPKLKSG